jgi:hypothetical protein
LSDKRLYYFENRDHFREYHKKYYQTHKEQFHEKWLRLKAKKKKLKNARNKGV